MKMEEPRKLPICKICETNVDNIKKKNMVFERKVSYAGRSRIITIPEDLARFLHLERGNLVRLIPVDSRSFLVEAQR